MSSPLATTVTPRSPASEKQTGRIWIWLGFLACAIITIALFFIPAFIIRPFRYQDPRALWLAMALRHRAPLGTSIAAALCILFIFILWKASRLWQRILLIVALLPILFSAVMARLNYFEWMFHPIDGAQFLAQSGSKLDAKEMIMAVRYGDDARAYPISQMAYHHVLNDTVGGVPIVATY